jgi:hypothetical protein
MRKTRDIDGADKIPYRSPWRIKLKERIWPPGEIQNMLLALESISEIY